MVAANGRGGLHHTQTDQFYRPTETGAEHALFAPSVTALRGLITWRMLSPSARIAAGRRRRDTGGVPVTITCRGYMDMGEQAEWVLGEAE